MSGKRVRKLNTGCRSYWRRNILHLALLATFEFDAFALLILEINLGKVVIHHQFHEGFDLFQIDHDA